MRIAVVLFLMLATPFALAEELTIPQDVSSFVGQFCLDCHDSTTATAELDLPAISRGEVTRGGMDHWEDVVRRLRARQMPPPDADLPIEQQYEDVVESLTNWLDTLAAKRPNPGRTSTLRRLTRTEYQNAIRDLLGVEIDASQLLPADQSSHGFDNITVGELSPTLLNRYLTAAQRISRAAIGVSETDVRVRTFRVRPDQTQEYHVPGLPLGTRGGTLIETVFPQSGDYEVQVLLTRDRNEEVEGLYKPHQIQVLLDRRVAAKFTVKPPPGRLNFQIVDANLKSRLHVSAGRHQLGVTFLRQAVSLEDTKRKPYLAHFNFHRHPRLGPAVYQVTVTGPFQPSGVGNTRSRRTIYGEHLDSTGKLVPRLNVDLGDELATQIISRLLRNAFRRPVNDADLRVPMRFFRDTFATVDGSQTHLEQRRHFELGIESALASILVNPNFLFRLESLPAGASPARPYTISDIELASRLSFMLWSSIPDEDLLRLAEQGRLSDRDVLQTQIRRMLSDKRSAALATNFASQWLHLRNLESITPDLRQFPDFDDNLRQAMRRETELLFESVVQDDLSVVQLLSADHTFLNERLAKHYSIPHIYGNRFRRIELDGTENRGGLLRQASILMVTSYATRTSPVIRGHWILENLLGSPPPPPPANVPTLGENTVNASLPIRERLEAHRANPACAGCHAMMDPIGFSLENFDAVGRWRERDVDIPINAGGNWGNQGAFSGVDGLEAALLKRPDLFVGTLTEKLLTFGLGRGIENSDAPAVRQIVREAKKDDYRFSSLILAIVESPPFQMRMSP
jgi:hypothetical protein